MKTQPRYKEHNGRMMRIAEPDYEKLEAIRLARIAALWRTVPPADAECYADLILNEIRKYEKMSKNWSYPLTWV